MARAPQGAHLGERAGGIAGRTTAGATPYDQSACDDC